MSFKPTKVYKELPCVYKDYWEPSCLYSVYVLRLIRTQLGVPSWATSHDIPGR